MKRLDEQTERNIQKFTREIQTLYGDDLVTLVLYGSAAGVDFVPARSNLNFLIVLQKVTPEALRKAAPLLKDWQRQRIATPLFVDPEFLQSSLDVFPIEFSEMQAQHHLLAGEDLLFDWTISPKNLRLQCEQELKGKLLNLRTGYLESAGRIEAIEELLTLSLKSFLIVTRYLLRLRGITVPREFLEIIGQTETAFGLSLESFREVHSLRLGVRRLDKENAHALFARYMREVEALTAYANQLCGEFSE